METRAKKRKLLAGPTTDPFILIEIPLIHDLILQHFTGNEVKELFKVGKEWNKIVSSSNASMKKVQLKYEEKSSTDPTNKQVTELLRTQRRYSNMEAGFEYKTNTQRKMQLLDRFSQTLVELDIDVYSKDLVQFAPRQLRFPKLKKLIVRDHANQLLPLMETKSLVKFEVLIFSDKHIDAKPISNFLKKQANLKELTLDGTNELFEQIDLTNEPFALTSFDTYVRDEMSPITILNLHLFLRNMSNSLEDFDVNQASSETIQLVVNEMPELWGISCNNCDVDIPNLKRNTSISMLMVKSIPTSIPKNLILALEELRYLKVGYDSMQNFKEDLKWIVKNAPKLEELKCKSSQTVGIRAEYQMLKAQDTSINQNIDIFKSEYLSLP